MSVNEDDAGSKAGFDRVTISDLQKIYRSRTDEVVAIEDVDLSVRDREFFCLLGPSGCGKSTLLRIIGDLTDPTDGGLDIDTTGLDSGQPLTNMVFQEHGVFPWKTVIDNVSFGLKMRGMSKQERYAIAREFIDKVDLTGFEDAYPHQLSGGMKQRVGIARAFANDPLILLMDEPFGALDAQTKEVLQEELLEIWDESDKTTIYVTHDIEEAILLGDRIGVMTHRPGRIKEILEVDISRPRTRETRDTEAFIELRSDIWDILGEEVQAAREMRAQK